MPGPSIVAQTLRLLGGELRDSEGRLLPLAEQPVVEVRDCSEARAALARASRVAMVVPLSGSGRLSRLVALSAARLRVNAARRCLFRAGANRVRAIAVAESGGELLLAYELGGEAQPYIEDNVVLQPPSSAAARLARRGFGMLSGQSVAVDLVAVVGERA